MFRKCVLVGLLLLGTIALGTDDVVILNEEAFADETHVADVTRETAAVPVTSFERHVTSPFGAKT